MFDEVSAVQQDIIEQVTDSLSGLDRTYNQGYEETKNDTLTSLSQFPNGEDNFIIFFSQMKDHELYAELISYNEELFKDKKRETVQYGKALTFLLTFDKNQNIKKVYTGETYLN